MSLAAAQTSDAFKEDRHTLTGGVDLADHPEIFMADDSRHLTYAGDAPAAGTRRVAHAFAQIRTGDSAASGTSH